MKNFKSFLLIALPLAVAFVSCKKTEHEVVPAQPLEQHRSSTLIGGTTGTLSTDLLFCSTMEVPLCAGRTVTMGTITVKTTRDNITYITYTTKDNWIIKELHLYAGPESEIPLGPGGNPAPGLFPYSVTFTAPWIVNSYTFIIADLPTEYTIAAHASVAKVRGITIIEQQTAWGDGCKGTKINPATGGSWGTKFTYSSATCAPEPDICSQPYEYFFDSANYDGSNIAWYDCNGEEEGQVTVAGFQYTEQEGRDIYNTVNADGTAFMPDAKEAFIHLAALKLSYTDYTQHSTLSAHVITVEDWLATKGKLSTTNLPDNANTNVRNSLQYIVDWIAAHPCMGRR
jgi:hypothetical protein